MEMHVIKKKAYRVTIISSIINTLLGTTQVVVGLLFHSQSLIMDGFHSLSDLFTDGFVLIVSKFSFEHADEEHPYGHGRFETLGTVVVGTVLISVALFMAFENLMLFMANKTKLVPGYPTLFVVGGSIIAKELLFRYAFKVGTEIKSEMVKANAWHARSDVITSVAVLIGLVFSINGYPQADLFVAVLLSFFIGRIGWRFIWKSVQELLDTSLSSEIRGEIKEMIKNVDGVRGLHNLRSRKVGGRAILDVNVEVVPNITVSEGHEIATWVAYKIINHFDNIYDVTVHTDVEDDRAPGTTYLSYENQLLPLRNEVIPQVQSILGDDDFSKITDIKLHYMVGKIHLDLYYNSETQFDKNATLSKFEGHKLFGKIKFFQEC